MKIDIDEAYINRSRTITPLNEVNSTLDVEIRPPNRSFTHCRAIACAANMHSAKRPVLIVREH